ncbi:ATP-binding protein [Tumebacillus lipolyticus]|uniref:histidine kinase n=1 Tax=Tumebacillus lipolyticus TaxID=1280370 RepID=A0ABW4ZZC4_9BACL
MSKKRILLIIGLFLVVLTALRLGWFYLHHPPDHPKVVQGVLDLRNWDFPDDRTITLDGEWEFIPARLLTPGIEGDHTAIADAKKSYIQVPGRWDDSFSDEQGARLHYGTYRLKILVDDDNMQTFGIRVVDIQSASEVYVNGRYVEGAGRPTEQRELYTARNVPYQGSFRADQNEIEVLIRVADHMESVKGSGIKKSLKFGYYDAVVNESLFSVGMQLLLCVVLFLHGMYAAILYFFRRQNRMLHFSLLVLSTIISVLVVESKLLFVWLPINSEWAIKLLYLSYTGVSAFLLQLVGQLVPEFKRMRSFRWLTALCILFALYMLLVPYEYTMMPNIMLIFVLMLPALAIWSTLFRAAGQGKADVIYLLLAATSVTTNIVWAITQSRGFIEETYYPFDLIIAFLSFAAYWFKRFFWANEQTEQLADKLQKADKMKDDFLANTSHELRNPLHGMLNIAQTVLDDNSKRLDEKNKQSLELLIKVGRRMSLMLNDLLDVTHLQERAIRLELRTLRVQSVAVGVLDMLRFMTDGKPIRFIVNIPDSFPAVSADENRLTQILFNLLHNAIKYTREGEITIGADVKGGMAHLHIQDTGIGIADDELSRIFQPYEQADSSITSAGGGLGLGLSICKQLVELHGGSLQVRSTVGQGSVFTFTLPLSRSADEEQWAMSEDVQADARAESAAEAMPMLMDESRSSVVTTALDRPRILAVDDDLINLKVLENLLSAEQYQITAVTSGSDAIAKLEAEHYDLVIADVMMPQMSGYELSRTIRKRYSISELPILLLTARSRSEDIYAGFDAGANDYVTKPMDAWELKSRVRALTDLKRSIVERLRMEAAWLQAQIQPHFLFNTLNSISALSEIDTKRMQALLDVFSTYLRMSFDSHISDRVVPLDRELALVRSYLYIEKERFGDRLQILWEVDEQVNLFLPPLSIQPLVENAVKHGVLRRSRGGTIRIRLLDHATHAELSIEDDGVGMAEERLRQVMAGQAEQHAGIGLRNTDRRLNQLYGKGLQIESAPDRGTTVRFDIPKR